MRKTFYLLIMLILVFPCFLSAEMENDNVIDSVVTPSEDTTEVTATANELVYPMPPERKEQLISYSRFKNIWRFASFFIEIIILGLILFTGFSSKLRTWAEKISDLRVIHWLFYILFFSLVFYIVNLPFEYYRGFIIEHEYGFSNLTSGEWFTEGLKGLAVSLIFSLILLSLLYWLINRFKRWWLYCALGMIPIMVLIIVIFPILISPMFNKFEPLQNKELAEQMTALAERAGIHDPDIYQVDGSKQTKKINAYFTGMFGTRRIVLYDNMIDNFSIDEIKYVMGHEIGHYKMYHIWKGLFIAVIIVFIAALLIDKLLPRFIDSYRHKLGFEKLGDIASLPLLMLFVTVFSFVAQPVQNGISRMHEYDCDEYGLELSGVTDEVAVTTFDKMSVFNLADPEPPGIIEFWFYTHPALNKRMENVKRYYKEINANP